MVTKVDDQGDRGQANDEKGLASIMRRRSGSNDEEEERGQPKHDFG